MVVMAIITSIVTKERLVNVNEIQCKKWLMIRIFSGYFAMLSILASISLLRVASASAIMSTAPVFVVLFSVVILKENFHMRYIYGILICFLGTSIMLLNEKKNNDNVGTTSRGSIIIGILFGILHIFFNSFVTIGMKAISSYNLPSNSQLYYTGIGHSLLSVFYFLIFGGFYFSIPYALFSCINGFINYIQNALLIAGLSRLDAIKVSPFFYISTVVVFVCSVTLLGEPIYISDIFGSLLILGYNIYNTKNPIKD